MKMLILFFCLFLVQQNYSQIKEEWVVKYAASETGYNVVSDMAVDNQGNVYVTGFSKFADTNDDYVTMKYSSTGERLWMVRYDRLIDNTFPHFDFARAIAVDQQGNVYVSGASQTAQGLENADIVTIKYNTNGDKLWEAVYAGPGGDQDQAYDMVLDNDGNIYVAGKSNGGASNLDFILIKYNPQGSEQWVARYNGTGNSADFVNDMAIDSQGFIYLTGGSEGSGTSTDYATVKYNSEGVEQWSARYDGVFSGEEYASAVAVDAAGNVYVTGRHMYETVKYNSSGEQQWVTSYKGPTNLGGIAYDIAVDNNGNVYITGGNWGTPYFDYATISYSSDGTERWVKRFNSPSSGEDYGYRLLLDEENNVYVTGTMWGSGGAGDDMATMKYSGTDGNELWFQQYNGLGESNVAGAMALDQNGNVYVAGGSIVYYGTPDDFIIVKYSQGTVDVNEPGMPDNYLLHQNYPNPFNPSTRIKFSVPEKSFLSLKIFNSLGEEMAELFSKEFDAGNYEYEWNAGSLSAGIYYYSLTGNNFSSTKKLVLMK